MEMAELNHMVNKTDLNNTHDDDERDLEGPGINSVLRVAYSSQLAPARFYAVVVCARASKFILYLRNDKIELKERN